MFDAKQLPTTSQQLSYMHIELYRKLLLNDLSTFIIKAFQILNPNTVYLHNWHIDLIAEYLQAVTTGEIKRLIINMPPRYLKSISVTIAWPAWLLARNPATRIITASYSGAISNKFSLDCRRLITSQWYRQCFPYVQLSPEQNQRSKFSTTLNGFRLATSVGGTLTGEGGDFLIIDDPHQPGQVASTKYRQRTLDWFSNTFSSRLDDKKTGAIVLVMQRLHEFDLTGYLLQNPQYQWELLKLPAIFTEANCYGLHHFQKQLTAGELLHPAREGAEELARIKAELGSLCFAAQYQQQPVTIHSSSLIQANWFQHFDPAQPMQSELTVLSFDTGIKIAEQNDPTVCTVWLIQQEHYYLQTVFREHLAYHQLRQFTIQKVQQYHPDYILIEDKASGQSLIQDLNHEFHWPIVPIKVKGDKLLRFVRAIAMIEAGHVLLPTEASWLADFEAELYAFPNAAHDDQVDSMTQFLLWVKERNLTKRQPSIRSLA